MTKIGIKYSKNVPQLINDLNCSIAITTYQANKLVVLNTPDGKLLSVSETEFEKPMGIAFNNENFAIATKTSVETYKKIQGENSDYNYYHKLSYHTGDLDIHDLFWFENKLWFINTKFSCLCSLDEYYNFKLEWKPYFIVDLKPNDHCHINGLAIDDNIPKFITALGDKDIAYSWHNSILNGGILMDVQNNEIILSNLPMPHSPRIYLGKLYLLLSATGEIIEVDISKKKYKILFNTESFIRGLDIYGDYFFVGVSKQRKEKSVFKELPIAKKTKMCGIKIIAMKSRKLIGEIIFLNDTEELFDIRIVPKSRSINFIEKNDNQFIIQDSDNNIFKNIKNKYYD